MKVGGMPPSGSHRVGRVDWSDISDRLLDHPEEDVLFDELMDIANVKSLYNSVRGGMTKVMRDIGGVVVPSMRDSLPTEDGRRRGNLWLRWEPSRDPASQYDARYLGKGRASE